MTLNEYQKRASLNSAHGLKGTPAICYCTFGIARGLGELSNEVKKLTMQKKRKTHSRSLAKATHEAGNILWYLSELCTVAGISLNDLARRSLDNV